MGGNTEMGFQLRCWRLNVPRPVREKHPKNYYLSPKELGGRGKSLDRKYRGRSGLNFGAKRKLWGGTAFTGKDAKLLTSKETVLLGMVGAMEKRPVWRDFRV